MCGRVVQIVFARDVNSACAGVFVGYVIGVCTGVWVVFESVSV